MSYLLGVTICPVQNFLEESRKLSDLHNSSRIISDIMLEINYWLQKKNIKAKIIYPNYQQSNKKIDCSNYLIYEVDEIINIKSIDSTGELELLKKFNDSFHVFSAIEPLTDNQYFSAYNNLKHCMNSLKNTYVFDQQIQQKGSKKCTICGKRSTVKLNINEKREHKFKEKEELCTPCLNKRKYDHESSYKSIYSVAVERWKEKRENKLEGISEILREIFADEDKYYHQKRIKAIINLLSRQNRLVKSKMQELEFEFKGKVDNKEIVNIKNKLQALYIKMEDIYKNDEGPNYEYTFIQFDIDQLGRWMSGEFLKNKEENLRKYQEKISGMLINFGRSLKENLKGVGEIIYSGGDDFLAVLPNENILKVLMVIDSKFKDEVRKHLEDDNEILAKMTYSVSVTMAPCRNSMGEVIRRSRVELANIKDRFENNLIPKNGVVINYIINNGKEVICYLEHEDSKQLFELVKGYQKFKSKISFSYIEKFEEIFSFINNIILTFAELSSFSLMAKYELERLIRRSILNKRNKTERIDNYIKDLVNFIEALISKNYLEKRANEITIDLINVINAMKLHKKLAESNLE